MPSGRGPVVYAGASPTIVVEEASYGLTKPLTKRLRHPKTTAVALHISYPFRGVIAMLKVRL